MTFTSTTQKMSPALALDFDALKERCLGRVDLALRVLEKFISQSDSDIARLENAIAARDCAEAARLAHLVRGSSLSVSADQLAECLYEVEQCAGDVAKGDTAQATNGWPALDSLITEVRMSYWRVGEAVHATIKGSDRDK